jgi:hypothetical protein
MLSPEEWTELHKAEDASKREIRRLQKSRQSVLVELERLKRIQCTIARHNDGSDPIAPGGGLPRHAVPMGPGLLWVAVQAILRSHKSPSRWLFFSLVANAAACSGAGWAMQFARDTGYLPPSSLHVSALLTMGGLVLAACAVVVLAVERRARRRYYVARGVRAAAPVLPAEEIVGTEPVAEVRRRTSEPVVTLLR